jgi:hypothetical protein
MTRNIMPIHPHRTPKDPLVAVYVRVVVERWVLPLIDSG